jgi:hypothetical protein
VADVIRQGGLPYRDAWDGKGPFAFYTYALVQRAGPAMLPVRVLDLIVVGAGAAAAGGIVAHLVGRLGGRTRGGADTWPRGRVGTAGVWTALLLVLTYYASDFWNTAQPDAWVAALAALGMLLLLRPDIASRPVALLLASVLMGVGLLQKPTFAAWLVLPALAVLLSGQPRPGLGRPGVGFRLALAVVATAAALVPAAMAAWWFVRQGALPQLVEGYLTVNLELSRSAVGGVLRALPWSLYRMLTTPIVVILPGVLLGVVWLARRDVRAMLLLVTWALTSWLMVAVQRRYFGYHWHPLSFSLAPLAGVGFAAAFRWSEREAPHAGSRVLAGGAMATLLLMLVLPLQVRIRDALARVTGRMDELTYVAQFPPDQAGLLGDDLRLAEYLRSHTRAGDRVAVWDSPLPNVLSARATPSRIGFFFPLVTPRQHGGSAPPGPAQERLRAEYLSALDAASTRHVAVTADALAGREPQPRKSIPMLFPELAARLEQAWVLTDSAGSYRIFSRRVP